MVLGWPVGPLRGVAPLPSPTRAGTSVQAGQCLCRTGFARIACTCLPTYSCYQLTPATLPTAPAIASPSTFSSIPSSSIQVSPSSSLFSSSSTPSSNPPKEESYPTSSTTSNPSNQNSSSTPNPSIQLSSFISTSSSLSSS